MLRKILGWGVGNDVNVPYMHAYTHPTCIETAYVILQHFALCLSILGSRGCGAIFLKDTTASEIKTPKKKPLAAGAWEPGIPKHNVNSTKSSKSIGKYTEF